MGLFLSEAAALHSCNCMVIFERGQVEGLVCSPCSAVT